jgi:hypothetical protein
MACRDTTLCDKSTHDIVLSMMTVSPVSYVFLVHSQNVRFQNVRFQNIRFTKLKDYKTLGFKTSGFKTSIEIKASKCQDFKFDLLNKQKVKELPSLHSYLK